MKSLIQTIAVAAIIAVPVASFAQSNAPLSRAQVRSELVQMEKAGYQPAANDLYYPNNMQSAQRRLDMKQVSGSAGGVQGGSSQSGGGAVSQAKWNDMYGH